MNIFNKPFTQFRFHQSCSLPFNNLKQVQDHRPEVHSPRYFHTTHSVSICLYQICCLLQMSWLSIACCYEEIIEDSSLLHWFPWKEYSSTQKLPCLGALQFRIVSEGLFVCISSPNWWGNTRVEFFTQTSLKMSGETTNMVILITDGVGESVLGMMTVFCHPEQARIEACDALSILCQSDTCKLSVVLVRRYSNIPYIPRETSCSLYLDMSTLSKGVAYAQFSLDRLHLCSLLPFSKTEVLLPIKVGG